MSEPTSALPEGQRIYAIGDIHGCLGLLRQLMEKVDLDASTSKTPARKIFLGDYVDRGLNSREVIDHLIALQKSEISPPIFLMGNHEKTMREVIMDRNEEAFADWMQFGGKETLMSYGVRPTSPGGPGAIITDLIEKTPAAHLEFLEDLEVSASFGDYFFCHAGVRPGIDLDAQTVDDLIWIRKPFLEYKKPFGKTVVHGHSIRLQAEFHPNRIGIDTGAYATGRLTALALEGTKQWLIQTA